MFKFHWAVTRHAGAAAENVPKIIRALIKKMGRFAKRRGPKNAGTVWSWGRPSSWFIYNPRTTAGCKFHSPTFKFEVDTDLATCVSGFC